MEQSKAAATSLKILLVEDDPTVRMFLRDTVEKTLGHQVVAEAVDGTEMVQKAVDLEPDVILFDIHLPNQDGLAALRQIYQQKIIAAVAVTADRDQDLVRRALEEHVLAYLVKPVEAHQLGPALQIAWARFQELNSLATENETLKQTLRNRKIIERAKGMLMKERGWSEAEAFRRIQRAAMNGRVPMIDLAQSILNGQKVDF